MSEQTYTVQVQRDFLERQAQARPIQALAELIWNALDADATRADVLLRYGELGLSEIIVRDNGHGIPHTDAPALFTRLGGSWKKPGMRTKTKGRTLHGHEGRGRFKAFALGRVADWRITYQHDDGNLYAYDMEIIEDSIQKFRVSDQTEIARGTTGVEVTISELHGEYPSIEPDNALPELTEIFALYLKDYRDIAIRLKGERIDPAAAIASMESFELAEIRDGDTAHPASLEIVEWRTATTRTLYLCSQDGFPLSRVTERRFHVGDFQFSAYLKSPFITELNRTGQLELAEMHPALNDAVYDAQETIKAYFRDRAAERARSVVEEWKEEKIYPYEGEPQSVLEDAERKVFDIVAVTASGYMPDFRNTDVKNKAMHLRLLRTAIEKSPKELQIIMNEVLQLPKRKQEELASLLEEASLSNIIEAAKEVADRLKFVDALDAILFDAQRKDKLKERTQLHKILEDNSWLFGEEYTLSASDRALTTVLRKHRKLLGDEIAIDKPVRTYSKERGIIDLMLSRQLRRHRSEDIEHLVVELKAPKVRIGKNELNQIQEYAFAVADDERFKRNNVKWTFWVVSDDIDGFAEKQILPNEYYEGTIHRRDDIVIAIKTWSQLIADNKARLQFFQEKLRHRVDDERSLKFLKEKYQKFLEGVVTEEDDRGEEAQHEEPKKETVEA